MKKLFLVLPLLLNAAFSQTLTPTVSPSSAKPGQTVTVSVSYAAGTANAAALQGQIQVSNPALTVGATAPGAASTSATKSVTCNPNTSSPLCAVEGMNSNTIGPGVVWTTTYVVPASASPGTAVFSLANTEGAAFAASPSVIGVIPVTAGPSSTLTITTGPVPDDLNGDGVVNAADVTIAVNQTIGTAACNTADVNGDSACNIIDVMTVIRAALGL